MLRTWRRCARSNRSQAGNGSTELHQNGFAQPLARDRSRGDVLSGFSRAEVGVAPSRSAVTFDETFFADDEAAIARRRRARGVRSEDVIRPAVRSSPSNGTRQPFEGTIDIRVNGESRGRLPVTEGRSSRTSFEAEAAGPDG